MLFRVAFALSRIWRHRLQRFATRPSVLRYRRRRLLGVEPLEKRRLLTTFEVNSFDDSVDANLGDGVAADTLGRCTLRAAVMEANAWPGDDTINLPAGTYALSLGGPAEDAAASGDLDVVGGYGKLTIVGAGATATIISAAAISERAFDVLGSATLQIEDLTMTGGQETDPSLTKTSSGGILYIEGTRSRWTAERTATS